MPCSADGKFAAWQPQGLRTGRSIFARRALRKFALVRRVPKIDRACVFAERVGGSESNSSHSNGIAKPGNEASVRNFPASRE